MSEFFAMGGYAAYIWPAYAVAAILLAGLWIASVRSLRARELGLEQAEPEDRRRGSR
jgi:heme exporter protein D